jgi:hypothetical protein
MGHNASDKDLFNKLQGLKQWRMHFAFIGRGGNDGALILDEHTIPQAAIMIAKAGSGGTIVVEGYCFDENGRTVFETKATPPESLASALRAVIERDAGLKLDPVCRAAAKRASTEQIAYVGSEPNPEGEAGYANLAPEGSDEAMESNMSPNLTDTDAYVNQLADEAIEQAKRRRGDPPNET